MFFAEEQCLLRALVSRQGRRRGLTLKRTDDNNTSRTDNIINYNMRTLIIIEKKNRGKTVYEDEQ